ncbi:hypothetical protein [Pseudomonas sp. P9_31]|uniref:hypothetical protein n=1 Tax=Pseudomonas sp. P9_31 TaxID=3043448 RepID=UPI002A3703DF|nr:hypothetical protein [Pseudomonas sp. P9_31]WPN56078.1 hypothetical protein QMK51_18175 [Pseudomonas sp. P9_31]
MFLPPVSVDGVDAAKAGSKVRTAEAPAASVSILLRVKTAMGMGQCQSVKHNPCGSGLARESGVSGDINVDCDAVFAGKPAQVPHRGSPVQLKLLNYTLAALQQ